MKIKGFSVLELVIVIVVIGILLSVIIIKFNVSTSQPTKGVLNSAGKLIK